MLLAIDVDLPHRSQSHLLNHAQMCIRDRYYGVNEAVDSTIWATSEKGDRRIGVMWHTQGSGKSISMLFYAGKLLAQPELKNPTIVVVTDRNDLDGQLFQTFSSGKDLIKQTPQQVERCV